MYNELLPYWKARCRSVRDNSVPIGWTDELNRRRIYHADQTQGSDVKGAFEWVLGESGYHDCLVLGIMLFTWEAGLEA